MIASRITRVIRSPRGRLRASSFNLLSLLVALNYFAFRTEIFSEERAAGHAEFDGTTAFARTSLNWETFDKDNAPPAIVVDILLPLSGLWLPIAPGIEATPGPASFHPIRDKSPPA